jgi:hypothetical protein
MHESKNAHVVHQEATDELVAVQYDLGLFIS